MKELAEQYHSPFIAEDYKRSAWTGWSVGFVIVFVWVALILLAPVAEMFGLTNISQPLYNFFSYLCHQMPSRTFHIENHAFAVCSRCFGVYSGLLLGFIGYLFFRPITETEPLPRFWLFLSLVPIGIDWMLGVFGIWENTFLSRYITGLILGIACAVFIVPALVELFGLLKRKK
jgi:uncharacterized membrane protein